MTMKFVSWKSGTYKIDRNTFGKFGEEIVKRELRKEGFKVRAFDDLLYRKRGCSKVQALVELCKENCPKYGEGEKKICERAEESSNSEWFLVNVVWRHCRHKLSKYCPQVCNRFCNSRKVLRIFEEVGGKQWRDRREGGLDFAAYKGSMAWKNLWVVEVKTGKHSELDESQKYFAERLKREMGMRLLQFHVKIDDELNYSVRFKGDKSALMRINK